MTNHSAAFGIAINPTVLHVLAIIFLATVIRSAFGFGEALVAVPLLSLYIPLEVAAPLAVLVSITVAAVVVVQDSQMIHVRSTVWLVLSTVCGIPLGLLLLTNSHQQIVKAVLGAIIIVFSVYSLIGRRMELQHDHRGLLLVCGFLAGVLGGAYGMNGPPLAIYGSLRRWSAQHFRATLQGYFLPASVLGMFGYWIAGLWTHAVTHYYLICLPLTLAGVALGRAINHRLRAETFLNYIYIGLIGIGVLVLVQATAARP